MCAEPWYEPGGFVDTTSRTRKRVVPHAMNTIKRTLSNLIMETVNLVKQTKPVTKPLVWIDCEMTGLDVYNDHIIEICCLITDGDLNVVDEQGYELTVYYDRLVLDLMNEWCIKQHGKLGLTEKVLAHPERTLPKVQQELLAYIKHYVPVGSAGILAGNTIHMDKFFMMREFKEVVDHLHYRVLDVLLLNELGHRHNPRLMQRMPHKSNSHTARLDILELIAQLRWLRDHYLKGPLEI